VALREVARLSERYIGVSLRAEKDSACLQSERNRECVRAMCPLYEERGAAQAPMGVCRARPGGKRRGAVSTSEQ